jgi:hypothetical protein
MQETHQILIAAGSGFRMHRPAVIWKHFDSSDPLPFRQRSAEAECLRFLPPAGQGYRV